MKSTKLFRHLVCLSFGEKRGGWYLKCIFYTFQTLWQVLHLINQTVITAIWNRKRQLRLRGVKLIIYVQQGHQRGHWRQSSALDTPEDCTHSSCLANNWINTATISTTCGHQHSHCKWCLQTGTKAQKSLLSFMNVGSRSDSYEWKRPDLEARRAISQSALSSFMMLILYNSDLILYKYWQSRTHILF